MTGQSSERDEMTFNADVARRFVEQSPYAMFCFVDGRFIFINEAFEQLFGVSKDEVASSDFNVMAHIAPNSRALIEERICGISSGKTSTQRYGFTALTKDGREISVENTVSYVPHEGTVAVIGSLRECPEYRGEGELSFERLFRRSPEAISIADSDGLILRVNDEFTSLFGYGEEEVRGKAIDDVIVPQERMEEARDLTERVRRGEHIRHESIRMRKDGTTVDVAMCLVPMIAGEGEEGVYGIYRDITKEKEEERLRRESEEKYRSLAETADHIYLVDNRRRYRFMNETYRERIGVPPEKVSDTTFDETHDRAAIEALQKVLNDVLATGASVQHEHVSRSDGKVFLRTVSPVRDEKGRINVFTVVSKDITALKRAEKALAESERKYRSIFETAADCILIMTRDGVIRDCNTRSGDVLGVPKEELTGRSILSIVHPDWKEETVSFLRDIVSHRDVRKMEVVVVREDGAEREVSITASVFVDEKTERTVICIIRDVTEIRHNQRTIKERTSYLEVLLATAPGPIVVRDKEKRLVEWNVAAEKLFGYGRDEVIGKDVDELITKPDTVEEAHAFTERSYGGLPLHQTETVRYAKDGTPVNVILESMPIFVDGVQEGVISSFINITALKKTEQNLTRHRDHLDMVNSIVRHDISNNLNVIKSALRMYKATQDGTLLVEAEGRVDRCAGVIQDMKSLEAFLIAHDGLKTCNIREKIREISRDYPGVTVTIRGVKQLVLADEALGSVVDNLLSNAVRHAEAARIDIDIKDEGKYCLVSVADDGSGIPDALKKKVFEKGFSSGAGGQTGMGLYLAKQTMERYGGRITLRDNTPQGSVFTLAFRRVL